MMRRLRRHETPCHTCLENSALLSSHALERRPFALLSSHALERFRPFASGWHGRTASRVPASRNS
eukprot:47280-Prymnesium_polylepis.1